jgi:hypothetical protein
MKNEKDSKKILQQLENDNAPFPEVMESNHRWANKEGKTLLEALDDTYTGYGEIHLTKEEAEIINSVFRRCSLYGFVDRLPLKDQERYSIIPSIIKDLAIDVKTDERTMYTTYKLSFKG